MTEVLILGGAGVLGQATLPHLAGHEVVATTRSLERLDAVRRLGATGAVCDVYDAEALAELVAETRPEIVVSFLTDLAAGDLDANRRLRREGGAHVVSAAVAGGARRLVVESIAFAAGDDAVAALEQGALGSGLDAVVLRFGLFWGPGTWYGTPPLDGRPVIHVAQVGRLAADLIFDAPPGVHEVVDEAPREKEAIRDV